MLRYLVGFPSMSKISKLEQRRFMKGSLHLVLICTTRIDAIYGESLGVGRAWNTYNLNLSVCTE